MNGESWITFILSLIIVAAIIYIAIHRLGHDAAPYAIGLGLAGVVAIFLAIKGVNENVDR